MTSVAELPVPTVRWDLSALFTGMDDPKIGEIWDLTMMKADAFAERYRGKIDSPELDARTLLMAIQELEAISQEMAKPMTYANLQFSVDSGNPDIGAFLQQQTELASQARVKLLFFELELQAAPDEAIERALLDDCMADYRHFVSVERAFRKHRLSESEEVILEEAANVGSRAWNRLFDEVTGNHIYKYLDPETGETEQMNQPQLLSRLRHPDRRIRQAAADAFSSGLAEQQRVLTLVHNTLLLDKSIEDRLRKHPSPENSRHLANELDAETVELVIDLTGRSYGVVDRYYQVKRQILRLDELTHIDRYAPLFSAEAPVEFDEAQKIVLEAFGEFSSTLQSRAKEFFDKKWIDAEPRPGKVGGAYCSYVTPDLHPFVFMNYLNKMDDVGTLAHELGHGVHASLSRSQSYFNFHGTLPLAELASTFAEMIVFEKLTAMASLEDRLALYAEKIEGVFATVFRQAAFYRYEKRVHRTRRESGELSAEQFGDIWQDELQQMFGSALKLGDQHRSWWMYVSHFVAVPFYVYAYTFGELLVLSLYALAKREGPSFERKYVQMLELGGSRSPEELMSLVGVDLRSPEFWQGGLDAISSLVATFEKLWAEYQAKQPTA